MPIDRSAILLQGPSRQLLAGCLRGRYDAGASIRTLTRGVGSYGFVRDLLVEAETEFRPGGEILRRFARRSAEDVIAEMVAGHPCPCRLHSKNPWQLLAEFVDERAQAAARELRCAS
ncbi:helix-turn-helix domain-containing protein [Umezawaea sp. Da 62-37]|uniref:helix-turn-helix domain-containing protein n=1 Tax=Umezawaea sp. Da 62-37 TaxID=3075927 RepID=UPI0037DD3C2F